MELLLWLLLGAAGGWMIGSILHVNRYTSFFYGIGGAGGGEFTRHFLRGSSNSFFIYTCITALCIGVIIIAAQHLHEMKN